MIEFKNIERVLFSVDEWPIRVKKIYVDSKIVWA